MRWYTYSNNNSGGRYWLDAEDYKRLGDLPNTVMIGWPRTDNNGVYHPPPIAKHVDPDWLGWYDRPCEGRACEVAFFANSMEDVIEQWEQVVGQNVDEEGCPCCGPPHFFFDWVEAELVERLNAFYENCNADK